jgi:hypothetical protein
MQRGRKRRRAGATAPLGDRAADPAHNERRRGWIGAYARDGGSGCESQTNSSKCSAFDKAKCINDLTFLLRVTLQPSGLREQPHVQKLGI